MVDRVSPERKALGGICPLDGCTNPSLIKSTGICAAHYHRHRTTGRYHAPSREERFWSKVDVGHPLGCWEWSAGTNSAGYGVFGWKESGKTKSVRAHRYAYELLVEKIGAGLHLDHLCRNPSCVNPDHLEPVTPRTNTLRGYGPSAKNAEASECANGHALTVDNVWVNPKTGARHCRPCSRRRWHEWKARTLANADREELAMARTGPRGVA